MPPSAAFRAEEDRAREVVALEELLGRAFELHFALLEEDGPIRDRQRDVERLLHDDHRLPASLELVDDLEHALDDDWCETERQLVDQRVLGFVEEPPREPQHLLLTTRQALRHLLLAFGELRE